MPYKDPEKQRQYQREWKAARRVEWFKGKVCVDCAVLCLPRHVVVPSSQAFSSQTSFTHGVRATPPPASSRSVGIRSERAPDELTGGGCVTQRVLAPQQQTPHDDRG